MFPKLRRWAGLTKLLENGPSSSPRLPHVIDPGFVRESRRYLAQTAVAALAMLAILAFTDSISDAALAAALGSSVIIVFVHPSSRAASIRSLCGGHLLALGIGSAFALLLFTPTVEAYLEGASLVRDAGLAASVGVLILAMALTDTEHPPAAGTVLAMANRPWDLETVVVIITAAVILAGFRRVLGRRLKSRLV